jgi:RNA polymerase sigma-70 factor (ECF subfamily)
LSDDGRDSRDDRALLSAHVEGDAEAFGVLFRRHRDRLWAVALRTTGDPEEAADALQDAMVAAFRRAGSYRGDAAVTTWLHRVVVNACLDRLRRRTVRTADGLPEDLGESAARSLPPTSTGGPRSSETADPADLVVVEEQRTLVLRALDRLAPDQKAALVLVDMQGYSVQEAAAILACAPGTVKSRCFRGRAKLVPLLAGLRPEPTGSAVRDSPESAPASPPGSAEQGTSGEPTGVAPRPSKEPVRGGEST